MRILYRKSDIGCFADCCNGEDHRREILANLMANLKKYDLAIELRGPSSGNYSDEDRALQVLQNFTESGLTWTMEAGDLLLIENSELD